MRNYFSHDIAARNDPKIMRLMRRHGGEGYGIFWVILEILATENENKLHLSDIDVIANLCGVSEEIVNSIIRDFGLFIIEGDYFYSESLRKRLNKAKIRSQLNSKAALKRWNKSDEDEDETEKMVI